LLTVPLLLPFQSMSPYSALSAIARSLLDRTPLPPIVASLRYIDATTDGDQLRVARELLDSSPRRPFEWLSKDS
jgi:hypothetical protein